MKNLTFKEVLALAEGELERGPIFVGGPSGGGKSWLSAQIGGALNVPVINLDKYSKHEGDKYNAYDFPVKKRAVYNGWPSNLVEVQKSLGFTLVITPIPSYSKFLEIHRAKVKNLKGMKGKTRSRDWHMKTAESSESEYHSFFTSFAKLVKKLLPGVRHESMTNDVKEVIGRGWFEH